MSKLDHVTLSVSKTLFQTNIQDASSEHKPKFGSTLLLPIECRRSNMSPGNPREISVDSTVASPCMHDQAGFDLSETVDGGLVYGQNRKSQKSVQWLKMPSVRLVDSGTSGGSPLAKSTEAFIIRINSRLSPKCVDTVYVYESNYISESAQDDSGRSSCFAY